MQEKKKNKKIRKVWKQIDKMQTQILTQTQVVNNLF